MELEWKWISIVEIGLKEVALVSHHSKQQAFPICASSSVPEGNAAIKCMLACAVPPHSWMSGFTC